MNLVHGPASAITAAYLSHPAVRVVTFTGSTAIGQQIMRMAADRVVRPLLELGGDAPFIVFADAEIDKAVDGAMLAKFRNTGQSCIAANRLYVHRGVFDEFIARLARRIDQMSIGDGVAENPPDLGPCIDMPSGCGAMGWSRRLSPPGPAGRPTRCRSAARAFAPPPC